MARAPRPSALRIRNTIFQSGVLLREIQRRLQEIEHRAHIHSQRRGQLQAQFEALKETVAALTRKAGPTDQDRNQRHEE